MKLSEPLEEEPGPSSSSRKKRPRSASKEFARKVRRTVHRKAQRSKVDCRRSPSSEELEESESEENEPGPLEDEPGPSNYPDRAIIQTEQKHPAEEIFDLIQANGEEGITRMCIKKKLHCKFSQFNLQL